MKILYACSEEIGLDLFKYLIEQNLVGAVLTSLDYKKRKNLIANPIKKYALEHNIKVYQPESLRTKEREFIKTLDVNFLLSFSYGKIFGPKFLALFEKGAFNIHPSDLPKYRGPSPINYTLLNQDKNTAITIQHLDLKMDEGDIVNKIDLSLTGYEDYNDLVKIFSSLAVDLFKEADFTKSYPQQGEASYTFKMDSQIKLDFSLNASKNISIIRSYNKAYCIYKNENLILKSSPSNIFSIFEKVDEKDGKILFFDKNKGLAISSNKEILYINRLQKAFSKEVSALDFYNSNRDCIGEYLNA